MTLPVIIHHGERRTDQSLIVIHGDKEFGIEPGGQLVVSLQDANDQLTIRQCLYSPENAAPSESEAQRETENPSTFDPSD